MKKSLLLTTTLVIILSTPQLFSQNCDINATANPTTITCGQSAVLTTFGSSSGQVVLDEDFNSGGFGSGWGSTPGATSFSNPCSPGGVDGTAHAWMDNNTSVPRTLTSASYDLTSATAGVSICFDLLFAEQGDNAPCEGPDEPDEGVYLEYSTDGGNTWTTIHYFDPNGGNDPQLTNWNNWCFALPAGAITSNTIIRWHQTADSGADYDHWGIDNVQIFQNDINAEVVWLHDNYSYGVGNPGGDNPTSVSPTSTTTYTSQITTGTGDICTADITVIVIDPVYDVNVSANPTTICAGDCADITGTAQIVLDPGGIETYENNQTEVVATGAASVNINIQTLNMTGVNPGSIQEICVNGFNFSGSELCTNFLGGCNCNGTNISFGDQCNIDASSFNITVSSPNGCEITLVPANTIITTGVQDMCFVPTGGAPISSGSGNYTGQFESSDPISNLDGCDANGVWTLEFNTGNGGFGFGFGSLTGWSITFDDPPVYAPVDISWSPTTNLSNPSSINTQACPSSSTDYELTVSTGTPGCEVHTEIVPITVNPCGGCVPPDQIINPLNTCAPGSVILSDAIGAGSDPATLTYHASQTDAQNDASPIATSASSTGSYWVRAEDPNDPTCFNVYEIVVTIDPLDDASFTLTDFCVGSTNAASNIATAGGTFAFNPVPGGGVTINSSTGAISNGVSGSTYSVEYTTVGACSATSIETVTVNALDDASFTLTDYCEGDPNAATNIATTGGTFAFNPVPGGGVTIDASTGAITNGIAGDTYTVEYTTSGACSSSSSETIDVINCSVPCGFVWNVSTNSTDNTVCNGVSTPCAIPGSVIINEVMPTPSGGNTSEEFQSMFNATTAYGHEWVELYNPSPCEAIDISCYSIGGMDGSSNGGTFSFPNGTTIPPLGFIVIGGPNAPNVDFDLNLAAPGQLWTSGATRWHLPNGDGWLALYDPSGNSVDGVYWTFASNDPTKISSDNTYDGTPQQAANCGGGVLSSAEVIFNAGGMEYITMATSAGQSFKRDSDGSMTWVQGAGTSGACNAVCVTPTPTGSSCDGTATVTPNSGLAPFTYLWDINAGSQTTQTATGLCAGNYCVTITDDNGCTETVCIDVVDNFTVEDPSFTLTDFCAGSANSATVIGTPGGIFTFSPDPMDGSTVDASTGEISNAVGGTTYSVEYTTPGACPESSIETVDAQVCCNIGLDTTSTVAPSCGQADGEINVQAVGGDGNYTYSLDGGAFVASNSFTALSAGTYQIEVQDGSGVCSDIINVQLTDLNAPVITAVNVVDPLCNGDLTGEIEIIANGGSGVLVFEIVNGTPISSNTSGQFTGLSADNYTINVRDDNDCLVTSTALIIDPSIVTINSQSTNVTCFGANDGTIDVVAGGGTPTYNYSIDNGVSWTSNTNFTGLSAQNYQVVVEDANGCQSVVEDVLITENGTLAINSVVIDETCYNLCDGSITLNVVGGTGPYDYSFNGGPQITSNSISNLCSGVHNYIVTDANGCSLNGNDTIIPAVRINPSITSIIDDGCSDICDGEIILTSNTGVNYTTNGTTNGTGVFTDLCEGIYVVSVEDANGCIETIQGVVGTIPQTVADFTHFPNPVTIFESEVNFTNTSSNASEYVWVISDDYGYYETYTSENLEHEFPSDTGEYLVCLTAINPAGCQDENCMVLVVEDDIVIFVPNAFTPDGDEFNQTFRAYVNGVDVYDFDFLIFNRWGELIWENHDPNKGWDGTYNGELVQEGAYVWKIVVKDVEVDFRKTYSGHVTILK